MNRKIIIFIVMIFVFVMLSKNILALGVTPGRTTLEYKPGTTPTVQFTIVNSEKKDMDLVVFVQGELNQSVSLSEVSFKMKAKEDSKTLSYTIEIPSGLSPGQHTSEVVIMQLPEKSPKSEAFVGAVVGVATQISIFVPYPGKYAESELNVIGPDNNGKIIFVMPVISRGELDLVKVRATVDVYTSLNEKITTLSTDEVSIPSKERKEIVAEWDSSKTAPGPYRAVATILYDEQTLKVEKEFNVGKQILNLESVEVNGFSLGEIAKFEILVENKWSQAIKGAYAQMQVLNDKGETMADFKSATQDIPPLSKALLVAFWDTAGVKKGTYNSKLFLKYGSSSEQKELKLEVKDNEINVVGIGYVISKQSGKTSGSSGLVTILVVVIIVLVILNLSWFLFLRKRLKK